MKEIKIEKIIEDIALPIVEQLGYELVNVEFVMEEGEWYLRVYIDKTEYEEDEEGITLDDCARVSRVLSEKLDEVDPIEQSYFLEVSSPGLDRPLKKDSDFIRFAGKKIKVELKEQVEGKKNMEGILKGLKEGKIIINVKGKELKLEKEKILEIRLNDF